MAAAHSRRNSTDQLNMNVP